MMVRAFVQAHDGKRWVTKPRRTRLASSSAHAPSKFDGFAGEGGDVRRRRYVAVQVQRVARGERFLCKDIQSSAGEVPLVQGVMQRASISNSTMGCVTSSGPGFTSDRFLLLRKRSVWAFISECRETMSGRFNTAPSSAP